MGKISLSIDGLPDARSWPAASAMLARGAAYLHRDDLRCPQHRVAHTGKLARAIVLDLCLSRLASPSAEAERLWQRAVARAGFVATRAAPDPEHGGLVYLPGRFDPRNCSNSVIDSGECTDALGQLLLDERAAALPASLRDRLHETVVRSAETYLSTAVVEKEITNQRLWGAMGLATAYAVESRAAWLIALQASLARSVAEQRPDGSWGYQPDAARQGAYPGAADLTVYYHSRCLAFLLHVLERVPAADLAGLISKALRRGLEFLDGVLLPNGLKPLALEGKRWFWDGSYEAGSAAYDTYALLRGAERFGRPEWRAVAWRCWRQLARHQQPNGSIVACLEPGNADFVCPDFHTADLAWPAQVLTALDDLALEQGGDRGDGLDEGRRAISEPVEAPLDQSRSSFVVRRSSFATAGVVRLDSPAGTIVARTTKLPCNSQFGGAAGGGALVAVCDRRGAERLRPVWETMTAAGGFLLYPARPAYWLALRRFLAANPPGREGRQWLFVARLLARQGRVTAALRRFWRGYFRPLLQLLPDPVSDRWALSASVESGEGWLRTSCRPARPDGSVPDWVHGATISHEYRMREDGEEAVARGVAGTVVSIGSAGTEEFVARGLVSRRPLLGGGRAPALRMRGTTSSEPSSPKRRAPALRMRGRDEEAVRLPDDADGRHAPGGSTGYTTDEPVVRVLDQIECPAAPEVGVVRYWLPAAAREIRVEASSAVRRLGRDGRALELRPRGAAARLVVEYAI